jgi:3-oxoacid CoA-transferase subunit B
MIITDLAVLTVGEKGLEVSELAPGVSHQELSAKTGVPLHFATA